MIVDAHHPIWRRADLPWLLGPTVPRIFGDYGPIKRDYPVAEYLGDVSGTGVAKSVYVQANWASNWFADEAAWVSHVHAETGWPHAVSAFCDMRQKDARRDIERLARMPLVRGVRHQMHHHENPLYRFAPARDTVAEEAVQRNVAALGDYGLLFELQIFAHQAEPALRLVDSCPGVTFVLQHAAMPADTSEPGMRRWREALDALASRRNVNAKLSGLGTFLRRNDPPLISRVVHETVSAFGAERCLFGSNFPIEKMWTSYGDLLAAYRDATAGLPDEDREAIFSGTATRLYRL